MKTRKLQSGRVVEEADHEVKITIESKCPEKWLFVDLETGDVWHHQSEEIGRNWRSATGREKNELRKLRMRR